MALGNYGTVRPADTNPEDMEVFYVYRADRASVASPAVQLNAKQVLKKITDPTDPSSSLGGLYNIELPATDFNKIGIYTVYIRPKKIKTKIIDCGVLAIDERSRGIVVDLSSLNPEDVYKFENNNLIGAMIEYYTFNPSVDTKIANLFRIATSNFRVEPIIDTLSTTSQKSVKYRANDNSNLMFISLSPSSSSQNLPNLIPYIGTPNQKISISLNNFNPYSLEINISEHSIDTIAYAIYGSQVKNIQNGVVTIYNDKGEIFWQGLEFSQQDPAGDALYTARLKKTNIDPNELIQNLNPPNSL